MKEIYRLEIINMEDTGEREKITGELAYANLPRTAFHQLASFKVTSTNNTLLLSSLSLDQILIASRQRCSELLVCPLVPPPAWLTDDGVLGEDSLNMVGGFRIIPPVNGCGVVTGEDEYR